MKSERLEPKRLKSERKADQREEVAYRKPVKDRLASLYRLHLI